MLNKTFDNSSAAILGPEHFARPIPGFPETVIVIFDNRLRDTFLARYDSKICSSLTFDRDNIYSLHHHGKNLAFFQSPIGAPATVAYLEEALVKGAKKILLFGTSGSLDSAYTDGKIVVPTHAYRDEGTSYHYAPAENFIEIATAARLAEILDELKVPYVQGKTWTTDALYRETKKNMQKRKRDGCITVEMECAAVMAMARFRGVEAYQFLFTADNLDAAEWESRMLTDLPNDAMERYIHIALEVAVRI